MTFVRNLISDLIARRLWPVALVLVVALVAVPVALSVDTEEAPTPVTPTANASVKPPVVGVADERSRGGRGPIGRNPFKQPGGSAQAGGPNARQAKAMEIYENTMDRIGDAVEGAAAPGAGGDVSWGSAPSVPGLDDVDVVPVGGGGSAGGSTPTTDRSSWHVDLRFGKDGKLTSRRDIPRLSPLPSADDPFFVFLGVLADGKTAMFLVSSDADATGDGRCYPSPQSCERVHMQAGDTEFFDVTTPSGDVVQYQLDLVRVARRTAASTSVAAQARSRESTEGREVLRSAVDTGQVEVSDLAYSRELGLVLPNGDVAKSGGLFGGFRVDLQFGSPGELVKRYNLARLTPLPSVEEPSFVYLGVLGDGETVLFLNPTEAATSGDAVCLPSPEQCQRVELKAGQSALFSAPTMDGQTKQYALDVDAVTRLEAATAEEARAGIRRESPAGRKILRTLINEVGSLVGDLSFSGDTGTVEPVAPQADPAAEAPAQPEGE